MSVYFVYRSHHEDPSCKHVRRLDADSVLGRCQAVWEGAKQAEDPISGRVDACLEVFERNPDQNLPDQARTLSNLGNLQKDQELCRGLARYEEAEPLYLRALSILQRARGPEHPMMVSLVHNLAALRQDQGRYDEAEALLRRSLAQREQVSGPGHLNTASILNNLAVLLMKQARYAEAEPLCNRALAAWESSLRPCSLQTARGEGQPGRVAERPGAVPGRRTAVPPGPGGV